MNPENNLRKNELLRHLSHCIMQKLPATGTMETGVANLYLSRHDEGHSCRRYLSEPASALIVHGEKIITMGQHEIHLKSGQNFVNCVYSPNSAIILNATADDPFLSVHFCLDKKIFSDLLMEMSNTGLSSYGQASMFNCHDVSLAYLETLSRLISLLDNPADIPIISPLLIRELYYYLLTGPQGAMLRDLYMSDSRDSRIMESIAWIKRHLNEPINIEALARHANMSISSLHRHFKSITGFSPLQYHKQLRLYEAQRLMLTENERADMAAMAVGYESITQFNREYKRMFGLPPHRDIKRRRANIRD